MRYFKFITAFLILLQVSLFAQEPSKKFGEVLKSDFDFMPSAPDKSAEALVLFDIGRSHFTELLDVFEIVFEKTTRIRILSEEGLKWAQIEIPFYQKREVYEKIENLEVYVYNVVNGRLQKSKISSFDIKEEIVSKFWKVRKISIPGVKVGSIIEYRYNLRSQNIFKLREWSFQWEIPVKHSQCDVQLIPLYEYTWSLQGADTFTSHERRELEELTREFGYSYCHSVSYKDMLDEFIIKDVPALKGDQFMASVKDNFIKIDFQLSTIRNTKGATTNFSTTWPILIRDFLRNNRFGRYVKRSKRLASGVLDIPGLKSKTEKERFDYIIDYVKTNYKWNGYSDKLSSQKSKNFISSKIGNGTDINLFVVGLLQSVGITSHPVLISTRDHGKINFKCPFIDYFNYALAYAEIDGKTRVVDATDSSLSSDKLPIACINGKGLLVRKGEFTLINLSSNHLSDIKTNIDIEIVNNDKHVKIVSWSNDYDALKNKSLYGEDKTLIKESLTKKGYDVADSSISVKNSKTYEEPYILRYSYNEKSSPSDNELDISPFASEALSSNPLVDINRKYSLDMVYPKRRTYNSSIHIPEGYKLARKPLDFAINNKLFSLNYHVENTNDIVNISFTYSFKSSKYSAKAYQKIKYYFSQIVLKGNEKLVLVKI